MLLILLVGAGGSSSYIIDLLRGLFFRDMLFDRLTSLVVLRSVAGSTLEKFVLLFLNRFSFQAWIV